MKNYKLQQDLNAAYLQYNYFTNPKDKEAISKAKERIRKAHMAIKMSEEGLL